MTLQDAIDTLFTDLELHQVIHIIAHKTYNNQSVTYSIGLALINKKIIYRIESDDYLAVNTYQMDSVGKAQDKLAWLINEYSLTIKSIIYMTALRTFELVALCFRDYMLTHTIETKMIALKEMLISYTINSNSLEYNDLVNDFNSILELTEKSKEKFGFEVILKQEKPINLVRKLKLASIDIY